jgi:hypothetical protein
MSEQSDNKQVLKLETLEFETGSAKELPPQDKARLALARWILGSLALIFILSCWWLVNAPNDRIEKAEEIFEFVKTMVPAIVTLVIGFYFRNEA